MTGSARDRSDGSVVGVSDHGGWAILVTVATDGSLLDRRRIELVDDDLPALPHHHEAKLLPPEQAEALVERVKASAQSHAAVALDALAAAVPAVRGIALRLRPDLPPTTIERIRDYRASNVADWVMYRTALADAALARGWRVRWYDPKRVSTQAAAALSVKNFDAYFQAMRVTVGPPWNQDHRLALAAGIVATHDEVR